MPDRLGWRNAPTRFVERKCLKHVTDVLPSTSPSARECPHGPEPETSVIVLPPSIQYVDDAPDVLHTGLLHAEVLPATGRRAFAAQLQTS